MTALPPRTSPWSPALWPECRSLPIHVLPSFRPLLPRGLPVSPPPCPRRVLPWVPVPSLHPFLCRLLPYSKVPFFLIPPFFYLPRSCVFCLLLSSWMNYLRLTPPTLSSILFYFSPQRRCLPSTSHFASVLLPSKRIISPSLPPPCHPIHLPFDSSTRCFLYRPCLALSFQRQCLPVPFLLPSHCLKGFFARSPQAPFFHPYPITSAVPPPQLCSPHLRPFLPSPDDSSPPPPPHFFPAPCPYAFLPPYPSAHDPDFPLGQRACATGPSLTCSLSLLLPGGLFTRMAFHAGGEQSCGG